MARDKTVPLLIRLPEDMDRLLRVRAKHETRSVNNLIVHLLRQMFAAELAQHETKKSSDAD